VCELCKNVFNVHTAPPSVPPDCVDGRTGHQVVQRPDDAEDVVRERLRVYEEKTRKPLSSFYSYTGLVRTVDADGEIDGVTRRLLDTLKAGSDASERPARAPQAKRRAAKRRPVAKKKARARKPVRKNAARRAKPAAARRRVAAKRARKVVRKARPARRKSSKRR
jgi:hypothetical protein